MSDRWEELTQLGVAFDALKTQDRPAQIRMLQYLSDRLEADYRTAMKSREVGAKKRVAPKVKP